MTDRTGLLRRPAVRTLALLVALAARMSGAEETDRPYGLERRIPWTTSRLVGSPEPPLPYTVERVFAQLELKAPIYLAEEPHSGRLIVILAGGEPERPTRLLSVANDRDPSSAEPFFELPRRLAYALCFHPQYERNGCVYLMTNGPTGDAERNNRISRFVVQRDSGPRIQADSEQVILEWHSAGHDGGGLAFGNDGMLYISTGDGTSDSDGWNSGQTLDDLLGAILRIDVDRQDAAHPYAIPSDNPFVSVAGARPEIWAYGLRNPWRLSFDQRSGQLWVGNNGQDLWETAHLVGRGENYGWSVYEGSHPFYLGRKLGPTPHVPPTIEHHHAEFRSLTGGVVYRGGQFPELDGAYIYGDYSSGRIWGMLHDGGRPIWHRELADASLAIVAFCQRAQGDLLIADHGTGVYRLCAAPPAEIQAPFPTRLSETGLFAGLAPLSPAPGVVAYSVNAPAWADGAIAERFAAIPEGSGIDYSSSASWNFPDGAALAQNFSLERTPGDPASRFLVETRILLRQQGEWAGYSYRWDEDQSDAVLIDKRGLEAQYAMGASAGSGPRTIAWRFPSRAECMACHSRAANYVLGLCEAQLNREHDYGPIRDNQLRAWNRAGMFSRPLGASAENRQQFVDPYDGALDVESRVRAYLHVNCSVCHVEAGGGNAKMELRASTPRDRMQLIGARPQHDTFGLDNAMLVAPGDPERSVIVQRLSRRGPGQMPPLVSAQIDECAVALFRDWIAELKPDRPIVRQWAMEDFESIGSQDVAGRSRTAGKSSFRDTGCIQCHRFAGEGGVVGPDLTGIGKRLAARELLESILLPSKTIAEGYAGVAIETEDGKIVTGRIEREDSQTLVVRPASSAEQPIEIRLADIVERQPLAQSNMPSGTVNALHREEILELLAYLLGEGQP